MKFASLEQFDIEPKKLLAIAVAVSVTAGLVFRYAVGGVLGTGTSVVQIVVSGIVFYVVVSAPKRVQKSAALSQARNAVPFAVLAKACLSVSGSRARTLIYLSSRDGAISSALQLAKKRTLLGLGVGGSLELAASRLSSYSASNVLRGLAGLSPESISDRGEENAGLSHSSQLSHETKFPIFMTVCFFTPILLLLYSVFSHFVDPGSFAELLALQVVMLDLAFYLCSAERKDRV